ncbi:MAG: trypsin-like serine protease [Blastocatellia bacterium]|nr:trypsin-like serine protease [Blastocatellia bacterium]
MFCLIFAVALAVTGRFTQINPSLSAHTNGKQITLNGPLPRWHPDAQVDPALLQIPQIPQPVYQTDAEIPDSVPVEYDLKTGQVTVLAAAPEIHPGLERNLFAPGFNGHDNRWADENPRPQSVIGTDDRVKITDTTVLPWRTVCKMYMTFPNGQQYIGSGTLIAAKYMLTAGHCVYSSADGGYATRIEVVPGQNGTYRPYGSALATKLRAFSGFVSSGSSNDDMALVTLDKNIGTTTGFLAYASLTTVNGITGNIAGYPGDRDGGINMYYHSGAISSSNTYRVFYSIDTYGGQSGSGVYQRVNDTRTIFAVHTNGGSTNAGTRINSSKYSTLQSWIASGS